jgi:hypothetical protein
MNCEAHKRADCADQWARKTTEPGRVLIKQQEACTMGNSISAVLHSDTLIKNFPININTKKHDE